MAPGTREVKLSPALAHAFEALKFASAHPDSTQVLCFPGTGQLEELQPVIEGLIKAESYPAGAAPELCVWPAWEQSPYSPISSSITQRIERLKTLARLSGGSRPLLILATAESWIQPTLPVADYRRAGISIRIDHDLGSHDQIHLALRKCGYSRTDLVEEPGQYALRGEILDIFDPANTLPVRAGLFDTVPESIHFFHPETQRTLKDLATPREIRIRPAEEVLFPLDQPGPALEQIKEYCDLNQISRKVRDPVFENIRNGFLPEHFRTWSPFVYSDPGRLEHHLPEGSRLVFFEPEQQKTALKEKRVELEADLAKYPQPHWITPGIDLLFPDLEHGLDAAIARAESLVLSVPDSPDAQPPVAFETIDPRKIQTKEVREWIEDGYRIWIGTRGASHQERLRFQLGDLALSGSLRFLPVDPGASLEFPAHKQLILSETLFFGSQTPKNSKPAPATHPRFEQSEGLEFHHHEDLAPGDLVVHALHGVGRYVGLQELSAGGKHAGEYLLIEYSGGDKLYLPVYRLNTIQRYVSTGTSAALDRLG
ncbi:MAG: hypothetical protein EBX52_12085, partial [Proteobacteria bacterium]|nr:hypothetical protein [Pseudomonadota bacterium]